MEKNIERKNQIKNTKIKRVIFGVLIVIWMITIFCFSSEQSTQSSGTSKAVIKTGLSQVKNFKEMEEPKQNELIEELQHPTRKLAHFTIYMIGGLIIFSFVNTFNICAKKKFVYAILFGLLYASSDEIHQLFTDGRSGQITDVLIDTSGVCIGCIIQYFLNSWRSKLKWRKTISK